MMISLCDRFRALPREGGIGDQDVYLYVQLELVELGKIEQEKKPANGGS